VTFAFGPSIGWLRFTIFVVMSDQSNQDNTIWINSLCPILPENIGRDVKFSKYVIRQNALIELTDLSYEKSRFEIKEWIDYFKDNLKGIALDSIYRIYNELPVPNDSKNNMKYQDFLPNQPYTVNIQKSRYYGLSSISDMLFIDTSSDETVVRGDGRDVCPIFYTVGRSNEETGEQCMFISYLDLHPSVNSNNSNNSNNNYNDNDINSNSSNSSNNSNNNSHISSLDLHLGIHPSTNFEGKFDFAVIDKIKKDYTQEMAALPPIIAIIPDEVRSEVFYLIR
jgi:hypothetical protein